MNLEKDYTKSGFADPRENGEGKFDVGGVRYPKAAIGSHTVILLEDAKRNYQVLMGRRAEHLAHGGKFSLMGGYIDLADSDSVSRAAVRELSEETNGHISASLNDIQLVSSYIDYTDQHNGACVSLGNRMVLRGDRVQAIRDFVESGVGVENNTEVSEFRLFDLATIEADLLQEGGAAYPHELRSILIVQQQIEQARQMEEALLQWARDPGAKHLWRVDLFTQEFVSTRDPNKTMSPAEFLEMTEERARVR